MPQRTSAPNISASLEATPVTLTLTRATFTRETFFVKMHLNWNFLFLFICLSKAGKKKVEAF